MKGIVFSEFIEMVESKFSLETADTIIESSKLPSDGAYTSVGTYDHTELLTLVTSLAEETRLPVDQLVRTFGSHLAGRFLELYPSFFKSTTGLFDFLNTVDQHIHVEVKKLYPEAELPLFDTEGLDKNKMKMTYRSKRPFADLAEGLILGSADIFKDSIRIERDDSMEDDYYKSEFLIIRI